MARRASLEWALLAILLLLLFWLRMELATSVGSLSYESYLTVREVDHVLETGSPLRVDPLSVMGSDRVGSPVFTYLLAGLVLLSDHMYKIVPNLAMMLLLIPLYLLTRSITKSQAASFIAVALAATSPAFFGSYIVTPSSAPIAVGLLLTILLLMQDIDKYLISIVACALLLTFLSPIVFVLVLALLMIIALLRIEGFGVDRKVNELFFFTLLLAVWFHVLVYKRPLFEEGVRVLWQNLPAKYAALQFGAVGFVDLVYGLGTVTFLFGMFGAYHALFEMRAKTPYSVVGAILAVFLLVVLRLAEISLGLLLLSVLLAVMAGHGIFVATRYILKTKTPWLIYPVAALVVALFTFSALVPALTHAFASLQNVPTDKDISAYSALRVELPRGAVLLTTVREGAAVQYFSGHATLMDHDFLLLGNGEELVRDVDIVYGSPFTVSVVGKADKYGFTHILLSGDAQRQYGRDSLAAGASACLPSRQLPGDAVLYRVACTGVQG